MGNRTCRNDESSDLETVTLAGDRGGGNGLARFVDRFFDSVWSRKAYHLVAGGLLATASLVLSNSWFAALCLAWLVLFGLASKRISTAVLGLLLLALLTGARLTIFGAALIFVVGDGVAALAGTALGRTRLPWHEQKSVAGSLAFLASATIAMLIALPAMFICSPAQLVLLAVLPSTVGCLAEAQPFALVRDIRDGKPDDNLLVILSSGAMLHFLIGFLHIRAIR